MRRLPDLSIPFQDRAQGIVSAKSTGSQPPRKKSWSKKEIILAYNLLKSVMEKFNIQTT
jgi:hypothetical protein